MRYYFLWLTVLLVALAFQSWLALIIGAVLHFVMYQHERNEQAVENAKLESQRLGQEEKDLLRFRDIVANRQQVRDCIESIIRLKTEYSGLASLSEISHITSKVQSLDRVFVLRHYIGQQSIPYDLRYKWEDLYPTECGLFIDRMRFDSGTGWFRSAETYWYFDAAGEPIAFSVDIIDRMTPVESIESPLMLDARGVFCIFLPTFDAIAVRSSVCFRGQIREERQYLDVVRKADIKVPHSVRDDFKKYSASKF